MDINQKVRSPAITEAFADVQMRDLLAECHGPELQFTYFDGSEPVNSVWATPGITIKKGGLLPFGEGAPGSDHRMTWIDISCHTAFGNIPPRQFPPRLDDFSFGINALSRNLILSGSSTT